MKMLQCGLGLTICKIYLAVLDACVSIVTVGNLLGTPFREKLGVREGAAESPNLFNVYIEDLRQTLEAQHPRLCHMLGIVIACILYADDAAIPADSLEDMQLAVQILEEF